MTCTARTICQILMQALLCGLFFRTTYSQSIDEIVEPTVVTASNSAPLPGAARLELTGDIASQMVDGIDRFLLRKLAESPARREVHWSRDFSSPAAFSKSVEPNRARLAKMI